MEESIHYDVPILKQGPADCVQHSFSLAMRGIGIHVTAQEIIEKIPVNKRPDGSAWGTSPAAVAAFLARTFPVHITAFSSDATVTDLAWSNYSGSDIKKELNSMLKRIDEVALTNISRKNVEIYLRDYLQLLESGGNLKIGLITKDILKEYLRNGPIVTTVCAQHFYADANRGRWYFTENEVEQVYDSVLGRPNNHTIVLSGYSLNGFTVVDPFTATEKEFDFEFITLAIAAAQIESDNVFYALSKN